MPRETLLDFFRGSRRRKASFWSGTTATAPGPHLRRGGARGPAFAARLRARGIGKGEKVVFWSENRPEWMAALWGCLLEGVIAVPMDFRSSADF